MVEFALVSVVAFLLMFGAADMALIIFGNSVGSNAARDGARYGTINYVDADVAGSANNAAIVSEVRRRLAGNIVLQSVNVVCRPATDLTATEACQTGTVDFGRSDLIEVRATWRHKGVSPFVPVTSHSATARMVIGGAPDLSAPPTTAPTTTTTAAPTTTTTAPARASMISSQMADNDHDGYVDQVLVTFSGAISTSCTTGWTLANVPSGGSLAGVTVTGSTAALTITEGTGARNTAVGTFTVAFSPSGACTNANGFGATPPSDGAGPVFVSLADGNGNTDGKAEPGDTLDMTFSEPLSPTWGPSVTVTATLARGGNQPATLAVPSLATVSSFELGSPNYVGKNKTATFGGSTLSVSGATVRLTLGPNCTGCGDTAVGQGSFSFAPSSTIRDAAGYLAQGPVAATNYKLF
jgi:hypothetical protein